MALTLAFDVYGTLIDTQGVITALEVLIGDRAKEFSQTWRDKQLEYSFRRGLMNTYVDFGVCTSQALSYTCLYYQYSFTDEQKKVLLDSYSCLPVFGDVEDGLAQLKDKNIRLYAFSNGSRKAVEELLKNAGIKKYFDGVVSCDDVRTFKPNPSVYTHFLKVTQASSKDTWLISSNPFDIIGAVSTGWQSAWVQRSNNAVFDPWEIEPRVKISRLDELYENLTQSES